MAKLLYIKANPKPDGESRTFRISKALSPLTGRPIRRPNHTRNLYDEEVKPITANSSGPGPILKTTVLKHRSTSMPMNLKRLIKSLSPHRCGISVFPPSSNATWITSWPSESLSSIPKKGR